VQEQLVVEHLVLVVVELAVGLALLIALDVECRLGIVFLGQILRLDVRAIIGKEKQLID
jgi:hypothetical protein